MAAAILNLRQNPIRKTVRLNILSQIPKLLLASKWKSVKGQNVQTSGDQKIAVYADTEPSKNFASMMTWTVTEEPAGAATVSDISDK